MSSVAPFSADTVRRWIELEPLVFGNHGAVYEGDIFSILKQSPLVIRAFEFARADGAIHCGGAFAPDTPYADRFWETDQQLRHLKDRKLVLFDIKSTIVRYAGDQHHKTTKAQRREVAFYIGLGAAEPDFVDLIPNFDQQESAAWKPKQKGDEEEVDVNTSRVARLPPETYGLLDPCGAPYRMRIALLPEAIQRVRDCMEGRGHYINPGNGVVFPNWKPLATTSIRSLKPGEESQHFSAYIAAREIYRHINKLQPQPLTARFDFIGVQPRLADFKVILLDNRQVFIQHKLCSRDRARDNQLNKVAIGRGGGNSGKQSWYFTDIDRFDFLCYQFQFSQRGAKTPDLLFFLPEYIIPDEFYTTHSIEASFDCAEFMPYRINMDSEGIWVQKMLEIIHACPTPRTLTARPVREPRPQPTPPAKAAVKRAARTQASPSGPLADSSRRRYHDILAHSQTRFFHNIMRQCAIRRSGLLCVLATDHPMGDFGFLRYRWKDFEAEKYLRGPFQFPPKVVHELPGNTPIVAVNYYARDLECTSVGADITSAQFRRINSCTHPRLIIWDIAGPDSIDRPGPLLLVPSIDLQPTEAQFQRFVDNLAVNHAVDFTDRTAVVSSLFSNGCVASDYRFGNEGALAYDGDIWGKLWGMLDAFTKPPPFEHPAGYVRDTALFRHPLKLLHRRLVEEYSHLAAEQPDNAL